MSEEAIYQLCVCVVVDCVTPGQLEKRFQIKKKPQVGVERGSKRKITQWDRAQLQGHQDPLKTVLLHVDANLRAWFRDWIRRKVDDYD